MADEQTDNSLLSLTAEIVSAHVANNSVAANDLPILIESVFGALSTLGAPVEPIASAKPKGAVGVRASIKPDFLVSMIDGKPYKVLRRHLSTHGHTPESYREEFGLPRDYPMVAANYADRRRAIAHQVGLGRRKTGDEAADPTTKPRGRPRKV